MQSEYNQKIRPILDTFDEIGSILRNEEIDLPKIVVVGDQSSGKSSVLESITGISLPRGEGTVTKCPIIIQSRSVKREEDEMAILNIEDFPELDTKVSLVNFPDALSDLQNKLIDKKKEKITASPLTVKFFKRNIPDLTLYDLPGITYKDGLTDKIRDIIKRYTKGALTIILLILPANVDLTNTEAIELIQKNEDFKDRSLPVITKIDLGENDIFKKISTNELGLKYEPIVVRNRTKEELEKNDPIDVIRNRERELIDGNDDLRKLPESSKGTKNLIKFLIDIQKEKLHSSKVKIKEQIRDTINEIDPQIESLPEPVDTFSQKIDKFKDCLNYFDQNFKSIIETGEICEEFDKFSMDTNSKNNQSKKDRNPSNLDETEINICYGIRIKFDKFKTKVDGLLSDFFNDNFYKYIKDLVEKSQGFNLQNFQNSSTMRKVFNNEIKKLETPLKNLIEDVCDLVLRVTKNLIVSAFGQYPTLNMMIIDEVISVLMEKQKGIKNVICKLLEIESNFKWTSSPNYIYFLEQGRKCYNDLKSRTVNTKYEPFYDYDILNSKLRIKSDCLFVKSNDLQHEAIKNIQLSCFSYWKIFESRFLEYARLFILNDSLYYLRDSLSTSIDKKFSPSSSEQAQGWICEDNSITIKRRKLVDSRDKLKTALKKLNKVL